LILLPRFIPIEEVNIDKFHLILYKPSKIALNLNLLSIDSRNLASERVFRCYTSATYVKNKPEGTIGALPTLSLIRYSDRWLNIYPEFEQTRDHPFHREVHHYLELLTRVSKRMRNGEMDAEERDLLLGIMES
jgi:hypothetical protein